MLDVFEHTDSLFVQQVVNIGAMKTLLVVLA